MSNETNQQQIFRRMANVDGTITPAEDAKISIFDRGFLYGETH